MNPSSEINQLPRSEHQNNSTPEQPEPYNWSSDSIFLRLSQYAFEPDSNSKDQENEKATMQSDTNDLKQKLMQQQNNYIKQDNSIRTTLRDLRVMYKRLYSDLNRSQNSDKTEIMPKQSELQNDYRPALEESRKNNRNSRPVESSPQTQHENYDYVFYDPKLHWCRICNKFPDTAGDYLNHLHTAEHLRAALQDMDAPWHRVQKVHAGFPKVPSKKSKRTPIKGVQFMVPTKGWYCKLCNLFVADLKTASDHFMSVVHSENYSDFEKKNPEWYNNWLCDRQKAYKMVLPQKRKSNSEVRKKKVRTQENYSFAGTAKVTKHYDPKS